MNTNPVATAGALQLALDEVIRLSREQSVCLTRGVPIPQALETRRERARCDADRLLDALLDSLGEPERLH